MVTNILAFPNSLANTRFLDDLHNFSMYVAIGGRPQNQAVVARLGDSEDTTLTRGVPRVTAEAIDEHPDLCEYVAEGSCPKEPVVSVGLGDGGDTIPSVTDLTTSLHKLPYLLEYRAHAPTWQPSLASVPQTLC